MKPALFEYIRVTTVDDAIRALESCNDAKVIAGGQSLVPMLNFRMVDTPLFIDINGIDDLRGITETSNGGLRIGALTRHFELEVSPLIQERYPLLHEAMKYVAHLAIRNRGTIGGSISHADPAAELPALAVLLDAMIVARGPRGERQIAAVDFFEAPLTTSLEADEIVTAVELPPLPENSGWGFEEFAQRHGEFAGVGVAALVGKYGARISVCGAHNTLAGKEQKKHSDPVMNAAPRRCNPKLIHPTICMALPTTAVILLAFCAKDAE